MKGEKRGKIWRVLGWFEQAIAVQFAVANYRPV